MQDPIRVLSLFSGCGGMDLGFEGHFYVPKVCVNTEMHPEWIKSDHGHGGVMLVPTGFTTVFANDLSPKAKAIWVKNFSRRGHSQDEYHIGSIVDMVRNARDGRFKLPHADIITGGFPCCDFSLSGKRKGFESDKDHRGEKRDGVPTEETRGMLYFWMREAISIVRPVAFVAENVDAMDSLDGVKEAIEADFASLGYFVSSMTLRSPSYGIPQTRDRIIFIGVRGKRPERWADLFPLPTHGESLFDPLFPMVKLKDVLDGLSEPMWSADHDQQAFAKNKWYGSHCQGQVEVDLEGNGPTIRAEHHGSIEFRRLSAGHGGRYRMELEAGLPERRLTVRECARIQTFPDSFSFVGNGVSMSDAYRAIGNAVPPLLAYNVAMRLKEVLF